jgi:hypothetical protein
MLLNVVYKSNVPRALRTLHNQATKATWQATGTEFHVKFRDRRFTNAHASAAQFAPRKGEQGSGVSFARSYTGKKLKKYGHTRPLELTGETRRAVTMATISGTSKGVKVAYPGARKFNYQNPNSNIRMADEFRRVIPSEVNSLADFFRTQLADRFKEKQNESL